MKKTKQNLHLVEVKNAGHKGRGVFAKNSIKKGVIIEISPYILVSAKDYNRHWTSDLQRYWYEVKGNVCAIGLGYTSLYNHSDEPNVECHLNPKTKTIKIVVLRNIKAGEELVIDYGYDPVTYFTK